MIVVPARKLAHMPDVFQSLMIGRFDDPINAEWFDLSNVPIGAELRLDTDQWRNIPLRRVAGNGLVEIARPEGA